MTQWFFLWIWRGLCGPLNCIGGASAALLTVLVGPLRPFDMCWRGPLNLAVFARDLSGSPRVDRPMCTVVFFCHCCGSMPTQAKATLHLVGIPLSGCLCVPGYNGHQRHSFAVVLDSPLSHFFRRRESKTEGVPSVLMIPQKGVPFCLGSLGTGVEHSLHLLLKGCTTAPFFFTNAVTMMCVILVTPG